MGRPRQSRRWPAQAGATPFPLAGSATDRLIALTGARDLRGKLPTRDWTQPYRGQVLAPDSYPRRTLDQILWLVVHHTGAGPARPTIQDTTAYQIGPTAQLAFPGFAYCGFVEADGSIRIAWDIETVTYSQGDGSPTEIDGVGSNNYHGIAFCFSGENPMDPQVAALHGIHAALETILNRPIVVQGHREVSGRSDTACPGDQMITRLGEV